MPCDRLGVVDHPTCSAEEGWLVGACGDLTADHLKRRPMPLTDWELWSVANLVIEQHGDDARAHALARRWSLEAEGDSGGVATWSSILARIGELQAKPITGH
jgi:hypothetical protein